MAHFGERLRLLRGRRSQKRIADELEVPPTTLSTLENQESLPRGEILEKLANYFGVPVSYFFQPKRAQPSEAARSYLTLIRSADPRSRGIVTHSTELLDEKDSEKVGEVIRKQDKIAQASHKQ
jgi:transcriptional regulator with XRE-family HTH domain